MEVLLKTKINEWKTSRGLEPYSDKTIANYISQIRKLAPENYTDMEWAKDTDAIAEKLSGFKPTTQRNYYNSLLVGLYASGMEKSSALTQHYETKRDLLNAKYQQMVGHNTENQQAILNKVNKDVIQDMLNKMKKLMEREEGIARQDYMAYVMINVYKHYQFRNDIAQMEVFFNKTFDEILQEERDNTNYLVLGKPPESMSFVLNNYKTKKKYGEKVIEIKEEELKNILREWIAFKINNKWELIEEKVIYLFDWATGTPLNRNDISHLLSRTFQKYLGFSVSTTLLRKIYGELPDDANTASEEEIKKVVHQASVSGHSVQMKGAVYAK
mgnify:CR=1 FL=1